MSNIKLPKTTVGLFLLFVAGASFALPAAAQAPDDRGAAYGDEYDAATDDNDDDDRYDRGDDDTDDTAALDDRDVTALSDEERRCASEFRGFDAASGTILNDDDERERCPYLF